MRHILVVVLLCLAWSLEPAAQTSPKLVVVVVVDQLRADYLELFDRHWRGGIRTLLSEGLVFENANYPYLNTVTCAGHATIGTGTLPRTHGMIANAWWHRDERRSPECTSDPDVAAVTYGAPVQVGSSPKRLLVPTFADELRAQKPGARVVALSLKSRGSIALAGRAGDAVVWFDDLAGTFTTSRTYAASPVAAVKQFIDANPYEKDFGRSWTLLGPPVSYLRPDAGVGERPPAGWTSLFPHAVATVPGGRGGTTGSLSGLWQATPMADSYMARMAASLVRSYSLGRGDTTDFLGISFSTLDDVGHAFGPDSREVEDILRHLDATLGTLIQALDTQVGRGNYVLGLSADHGVAPFAGFGRGGRIHSEDVRDRVEDTLTREFGVLQKGTYTEAMSGSDLYLSPGVFDRLKANPKVLADVQRAIEDLPGVARALRGDELSETSRDPAVRAAALSYAPGRSGDLVIVAEAYWTLAGRGVFAAMHGSMHPYDTHVPLILFGGGIKPGRSTTAATPADIAPTLAQLAGIRMPKAEGRVLREALR